MRIVLITEVYCGGKCTALHTVHFMNKVHIKQTSLSLKKKRSIAEINKDDLIIRSRAVLVDDNI